MTASLEATYSLVEETIGRQLRASERVIDVLGLDAALNNAKDELELAIRREQRRAVHRAIRLRMPPRLELTGPMAAVIVRLYRLGQREAHAELGRLGLSVTRRFAVDPVSFPERVRRHLRVILGGLSGLGIRVYNAQVEATLADATQEAIVAAMIRVLGARGIAAGIVSDALTSGLASTFEEADAQGLVGGWEYTAILDTGTCEECEPLDGAVYDSWAEIQQVLPDGGPNPQCLGQGRCRCRAVPLAP